MDVLASAVSAAFDALPQIRRDEIAQLLDATDAAIKGTSNNSSTLAAVKRTLLEELGLTVEETARAESRRKDFKWMVTGQPASVWSVDSCKGAWRAVRDVLEVKKEPKRVASSSPAGSSMRKRVRAEPQEQQPQEQQPQEQQPPQLADVENATDLSAPSDEDQLHADENSIARHAVTSKNGSSCCLCATASLSVSESPPVSLSLPLPVPLPPRAGSGSRYLGRAGARVAWVHRRLEIRSSAGCHARAPETRVPRFVLGRRIRG